jgi:propionyl-CoA carboxylase beta chain
MIMRQKLAEKEKRICWFYLQIRTLQHNVDFIDEVILPRDTRRKLLKAFSMLENKESVVPNRKHGNIPL